MALVAACRWRKEITRLPASAPTRRHRHPKPPTPSHRLPLFLAARLRAQGTPMPEPHKFSREQTAAWIAEDETDMQRFSEGK